MAFGAATAAFEHSSERWKAPSKPAMHQMAARNDIRKAIPSGQSVWLVNCDQTWLLVLNLVEERLFPAKSVMNVIAYEMMFNTDANWFTQDMYLVGNEAKTASKSINATLSK
ncbi:DEKNAAC103793 [Brettanomyces naardenensis]|uniref:DEKNAAC103793 n=1 Tax=Brettanomyces naardenensis TaxID=13370 RepID=A0A448YPA4_BRENA|nr:DEKNAAC103793 [Brettanomyces naardenensis]